MQITSKPHIHKDYRQDDYKMREKGSLHKNMMKPPTCQDPLGDSLEISQIKKREKPSTKPQTKLGSKWHDEDPKRTKRSPNDC